jgi:hypothetical protein
MKRKIENGIIKGYEIGESISIHKHITDPESWFVTIRPLQIFAQRLCKKDCTEQEIARYVSAMLHEKFIIISQLIKDVTQFT